MEKIIETKIHIGLEKPVKILHITDVHLVDYAEEDIPEKKEHLIRRRAVFEKEAGFPPHTQNEYFSEAFEIAERENALTVLTGDVTDIAAIGTRREFHRIADGHDFMYCPGSHEFADFCRTPGPDHAEIYKRNYDSFRESFPNLKVTFDSRTVGGLNVITIDNSEDYFTAEIYDKLRAEADRGLPMILFMHDPIGDWNLLRIRPINENMRRSPEEFLTSDSVLGFIGRCPLIKATFAGHWHGESEAVAPCGQKYYVTPGLFKGICRMITID